MFKGEDGSFIEDITNDPLGLLSLYNAAYVFSDGEPELEESITFARHHLESLEPKLGSPLAEQVKRALHLPLPRTYRRLEALRYMPEYEQEDGHNPILLELAKLEFNALQCVHLKELKAISKSSPKTTWSNVTGMEVLSVCFVHMMRLSNTYSFNVKLHVLYGQPFRLLLTYIHLVRLQIFLAIGCMGWIVRKERFLE